MLFKRLAAVIAIAAVCAVPLMGCGNKDNGMVDTPLMKPGTAPPPPPRPDKPTLTPNGNGGKG